MAKVSSFLSFGRFLSFGLGKPGSPGAAPPRMLFLHGRGDFFFKVSGTAQNQGLLQELASPMPPNPGRQDCIAMLLREDDNPRERNAIAVEISGCRIGTLPRHLATQYREWLQRWGLEASRARCLGVIVRLSGGDGTSPRYDVKLDLEIPFKMTTE